MGRCVPQSQAAQGGRTWASKKKRGTLGPNNRQKFWKLKHAQVLFGLKHLRCFASLGRKFNSKGSHSQVWLKSSIDLFSQHGKFNSSLCPLKGRCDPNQCVYPSRCWVTWRHRSVGNVSFQGCCHQCVFSTQSCGRNAHRTLWRVHTGSSILTSKSWKSGFTASVTSWKMASWTQPQLLSLFKMVFWQQRWHASTPVLSPPSPACEIGSSLPSLSVAIPGATLRTSRGQQR